MTEIRSIAAEFSLGPMNPDAGGAMQVRVDPDRCEGHGKCAQAAPAVFELRDDLSHVLMDDIPVSELDRVKNAVRLCPRQAIEIIEE